MHIKGVSDKVHVHTLHAWCRQQLSTYNVELPRNNGDDNIFYDEMVDKVIREVDRKASSRLKQSTNIGREQTLARCSAR